ncbi:coproporphyrinogen oxidase [Anseongella ginsenosidimutans]|uniref:coproporphyrinogen oxidase n=1 Tax=Anseongella ginsenosidimutans TaxID=496056 RepID=A0A4R3KRT2_9SPHI|nr:oxygen-dependent coproporphyrinogen oxidase [Anseongella ginsenosidimutans]QEC53124.1 oxygen-dependent coproporphyrinogen oxidase [Anseongella ginsenosidimutans]TCS87742.1 coproporphyrinogen oxidase [Anseongella ginsenosidimutans]
MLQQTTKNWFSQLQDDICGKLAEAGETTPFREDKWEREGGGGGRTRVIQEGAVFEKGGVNFSAVHGLLPEPVQQSFKVTESDFFATGVSIVLHPVNPLVPIIHMNVRYFELIDRKSGEVARQWFGGGIDLTPHYVDEADARYFHQTLKATCDRFHPDYYPHFKAWADDYFYIPHRKETRGIGGIFFDRLSANDTFSIMDRWEFVKAVGETFTKVYLPLVTKNMEKPFSEQEKQWQLLRRGRYVEFNLVYDAGTKFGLQTSGRIESILMSLPLHASWPYNFQPEAGGEEEKTSGWLRKGVDWA